MEGVLLVISTAIATSSGVSTNPPYGDGYSYGSGFGQFYGAYNNSETDTDVSPQYGMGNSLIPAPTLPADDCPWSQFGGSIPTCVANSVCVQDGDSFLAIHHGHSGVMTSIMYYCQCFPGYEKDADGLCQERTSCTLLCPFLNSICVNTAGAQACECVQNHERDEDGLCRPNSYFEFALSTVAGTKTKKTVGITLQLDGKTYSCFEGLRCYFDGVSTQQGTTSDAQNKITFTNDSPDALYIAGVVVNDRAGGRYWNLYQSFCLPLDYSGRVGSYSSTHARLSTACECDDGGIDSFVAGAFLVGNDFSFPSVSVLLDDDCLNEGRIVVSNSVSYAVNNECANTVQSSVSLDVMIAMVAFMVMVVAMNVFVIFRCLRFRSKQQSAANVYDDNQV